MNDRTPTVFVVDDDVAVCTSLRLLLRSVGLPAVTCSSAAEFLAQFDPDCPGCIVLDIRMPGMSDSFPGPDSSSGRNITR